MTMPDFLDYLFEWGRPCAPGGGGVGGNPFSASSLGRGSGDDLVSMAKHLLRKLFAVTSTMLLGRGRGRDDFEADDPHRLASAEASVGAQLKQAIQFFSRAVLQPDNAVGGSAAAIKARRQSRRLVIFLGVNVAFMLIELVVGFYSNSLSLLGDAGHMFFDCAALVIGLVATYVAKWDGNDHFTYVRVDEPSLCTTANTVISFCDVTSTV